MALSPVFVELKASIGDFRAKMGEASLEIEKLSKHGGGNFDKLAAVGKGALLGIAGVAVAVGAGALEMADKYETAHAKLEAALKGTGSNFDAVKGQVDKTVKGMAAFGFTAADTQTALAQFAISSGSATAGFKDMGLAADLAKFKQIPLSEAALLVAKALQGQLRPLKALGIDLPVATGSALKLAQAHDKLAVATEKVTAFLALHHNAMAAGDKYHTAYMKLVDGVTLAHAHLNTVASTSITIHDALTKRLGGQAAEAAKTFAGKVAAAKAEVENLGAQLGMKLIPVIEDVIKVVASIVDWFGRHKTITEILAGVIGGVLVIAIGAWAVGVAAAGVASVVAFAAFVAAAIPAIALVIAATWPLLLAVGALIAVGVLLWKNWDKVWGFIKAIVKDAWDWIKKHIDLIIDVALGPFGVAINFLRQHWSQVWDDIKSVVTTAARWISSTFDGIVGFFTGMPGRIAKAATGMWDGIKDAFRAVINTIIGWWNDLHFSVPKIHVWGTNIDVGGQEIGVPQIPLLGGGGGGGGGSVGSAVGGTQWTGGRSAQALQLHPDTIAGIGQATADALNGLSSSSRAYARGGASI